MDVRRARGGAAQSQNRRLRLRGMVVEIEGGRRARAWVLFVQVLQNPDGLGLGMFGIDHERYTYNLQGLQAKLTRVEPARVVNEILA